jgi:hypothetical protein
MHTRVIFILKWKEGETGKQANSERDRERARASVEALRKMDIGVCHKTGHWKNPLTSFWDKLERITIFWETFNGRVG